ncbi:MAG: hypothetical protein ABR909_02575 [Candidatus Bathyarchaeia archaeon]
MRMFLRHLTDLIKRPVFSSKWLFCSYVFLVVGEFLDGLTTKIGLDLGLTEVGTYAKGVLGNYGFWGLMAWKYSIIAAVGAMYFLFYYGVKKYDPARLKPVSNILTICCLLAGMVSVQVVVSNILQIELALHP